MKGLAVAYDRELEFSEGLGTGHHRALGAITSAPLATLEDARIWARRITLAPGASIIWELDHDEEAIYVLDGELEVAGRTCPSGGAIVVERDAAPSVTATTLTTAVLFGGGGDPDRRGSWVHVIGPDGTFRAEMEELSFVFFADASCPSCSIMLFAAGKGPHHVQEPHSHSQDEIVVMLDGSITMGSYHFVGGDSLAVSADRRYAFRGGADGHRFLNYRPALATMTNQDGSIRHEGGAINNLPVTNDRFDIESPFAAAGQGQVVASGSSRPGG